jgi:hypothetical protein
VLGNINNESTVFQRFQGGNVADGNYAHVPMIGTVAERTTWMQNFDNTRVYGTDSAYFPPLNATVDIVKTAMGVTTTPISNNNYQYVTENAQEYSYAWQENSTYAVFGGKYHPQFYIDSIVQANVTTNDPKIYFNGYTPDPDDALGGKFYGTEYTPVPYAPGNLDTIYYHSGYQVFIYGKSTLAKYYAWVQKVDAAAIQNTNPITVQAILDQIDADMNPANGADPVLHAYHQGQCFYRVFIKNQGGIPNEPQAEVVLVRRNHMYNINVTKILGPGIGNPNDIIKPEKPVEKTDTYVAIDIEIQKWHQVDQDEEVSL